MSQSQTFRELEEGKLEDHYWFHPPSESVAAFELAAGLRKRFELHAELRAKLGVPAPFLKSSTALPSMGHTHQAASLAARVLDSPQHQNTNKSPRDRARVNFALHTAHCRRDIQLAEARQTEHSHRRPMHSDQRPFGKMDLRRTNCLGRENDSARSRQHTRAPHLRLCPIVTLPEPLSTFPPLSHRSETHRPTTHPDRYHAAG